MDGAKAKWVLKWLTYLLLRWQGGRCAICQSVHAKRWELDHDHATNRPRGVVCSGCNQRIRVVESGRAPSFEPGDYQAYLCNPPAEQFLRLLEGAFVDA